MADSETNQTEEPKKSTWGSYFNKAKAAGSAGFSKAKEATMAKATELNNSDRAAWLKNKMGMWSKQAKDYMGSDSFKAAAAAVAAAAAAGAAALYSQELLDFMSNPTPEALQANPALLFELSAMMTEIRHPSAAIYHATLNSVVKGISDGGDGVMGAMANSAATAAVASGAASGAVANVVAKETGISVDASTIQSGLEMIPPDLIKEAVSQISPEQMFDLMKLLAKAK